MKRILCGLLLLAVASVASTAEAGRKHPPRYKYSSFGVWVKTNAPGYPAYRYTYSGQVNGFPPPAVFQYGAEHQNLTYGPGF